MRNFLMFLAMAATMSVLVSCDPDDGGDDNPTPSGETVTGALTEDVTWTADRIWTIEGRVIVPEGITLTIEPGTIVKGAEGNATTAAVLIVAQGGKLMAEGTAAEPIIFTSILDDIELGMTAGTNLTKEDKELWGGLIVLGKAPISAESESGDGSVSAIEGLPADEAYGVYGGTDIADNSGSMKYISIRHGGITIGEGNEINGLTLGGVGNGTTIENIEIYATLDDGIEFFGGSVDVTNAVVYFQGDDGIDIDQNWSGTLDNFVVVHGGTDTDEGLEIDGPENALNDGLFTLKNGFVATAGGDDPGTPADLKSKAQGTLDNILFSYTAGAALKFRSSYNDDCSGKTDALSNLVDGTLKIMNSQFSGVEVYTTSETCAVTVDDKRTAASAAVSASATGADLSAFSWTNAAEDLNIEVVSYEPVTKSGAIEADETWSADKIYVLDGRVIVTDGVTLTIEPGTVIKGKEGLESNASALIVARGGKLMAEGTADAPIVFTSVLDDILPGQKVGSNLTEEDKELWGGVIMLGNAPISAESESGDGSESSIEGLPADEAYGLYGGTDVADNSGSVKFVSIRHCGITIGEGNEINGLTLGGVGNGTTIENVEVYATLDDGIEFFGGSVNVTNALVYFQGDDGIDIDQNYSGTVDNFMVIHGGTDTDEGLEIDGPENALNDGLFTLINGTVMTAGGDDPGTPADLKSKAQGTIENVKFDYATDAELKIRASYTDNCSGKTDALSNLVDGTLKLTGSEFAGVKVYTTSDICTVAAGDQTAAEGAAVSATATGADATVFEWTAAAANDQL
ncbi:MAG: hypothetical protein JXQ90_11220 [Cyclobacteriaceae bacterium]